MPLAHTNVYITHHPDNDTRIVVRHRPPHADVTPAGQRRRRHMQRHHIAYNEQSALPARLCDTKKPGTQVPGFVGWITRLERATF